MTANENQTKADAAIIDMFECRTREGSGVYPRVEVSADLTLTKPGEIGSIDIETVKRALSASVRSAAVYVETSETQNQ